jgi:hypothetical protein
VVAAKAIGFRRLIPGTERRHGKIEGREEQAMKFKKLNSNQKSVLTLAGIVLIGLLVSSPATVIGMPAMVLWIALALWFYGVRDKK